MKRMRDLTFRMSCRRLLILSTAVVSTAAGSLLQAGVTNGIAGSATFFRLTAN
jgi:hypothetical protein